jgi:hypothetical protein
MEIYACFIALLSMLSLVLRSKVVAGRHIYSTISLNFKGCAAGNTSSTKDVSRELTYRDKQTQMIYVL